MIGDPAHLRVLPLTGGIELELAHDVPGIEAGEAWRIAAVSLAAEPVAGDAGAPGPGVAAAQGDEFTVCLKLFRSLRTGATRHQQGEQCVSEEARNTG